VALVAPAGPLRGVDDVRTGEENARALGWQPLVGRHVLGRSGYHAGSDDERLADLSWALTDPGVDGVWCLRGGYGVMRLLAKLDWSALASRPRPILGFSDITALLCGAASRAGIGGYHAPVARNPLTPFSLASLERATGQREDPCGSFPDGRTIRAGETQGALAGGNLALLAALCGTPYFPNLNGTILVLEDVNEPMYRVDRMLQQLLLAGALSGVRGIVAGQFTDCPERSDDDGSRSLHELLGELSDELRVPCASGAPVGHVDDQWTLPLGAHVLFDASERVLNVAFPAD